MNHSLRLPVTDQSAAGEARRRVAAWAGYETGTDSGDGDSGDGAGGRAGDGTSPAASRSASSSRFDCDYCHKSR